MITNITLHFFSVCVRVDARQKKAGRTILTVSDILLICIPSLAFLHLFLPHPHYISVAAVIPTFIQIYFSPEYLKQGK